MLRTEHRAEAVIVSLVDVRHEIDRRLDLVGAVIRRFIAMDLDRQTLVAVDPLALFRIHKHILALALLIEMGVNLGNERRRCFGWHFGGRFRREGRGGLRRLFGGHFGRLFGGGERGGYFLAAAGKQALALRCFRGCFRRLFGRHFGRCFRRRCFGGLFGRRFGRGVRPNGRRRHVFIG